MFKRDLKARFASTTHTLFWPTRKEESHNFETRQGYSGSRTLNKEEYASLLKRQEESPVMLLEVKEKHLKWWMFKNSFYFENEALTEQEVKTLALEEAIKRERRIQKAASIIEEQERFRNPPVVRLGKTKVELQGDVFKVSISEDGLSGEFTVPKSGIDKLVRIRRGELNFYFFKDAVYKFDKNDYSSQQMLSMIADLDSPRRRLAIPRKVRIEVWKRCEGKCVECSSQDNLEYDHIVPFSKGGSNTERNLQLLCEKCNRKKHNNI